MTTIIRTNTPADASRPIKRRTALLDSDINNGARCMFSLDSSWCFDGTVADGAIVRNMAYNNNTPYDMSLHVAAGQTVTHTGGGLDFSAMTDDEAYVQGNAGCLSSIAVGDQHFLVTAWLSLPAQADWNNEAALLSVFCATSDGESYATESDLVTIAQHNSGQLQARRQKDGGGTVDNIAIAPDATLWGQVCQIAYWRTATETGIRVKSKFGEKTTLGASGVANTGDFSAQLPKWGVPGSFTDLVGLAGHRNGTNTALYRGMIEDLEVSGRAPLAVADAEWAHVLENSGVL